MNAEETYNLYKKGKDAWNRWAGSMLNERTDLQQRGLWWPRNYSDGFSSERSDWNERSEVDFRSAKLNRNFNFSEFIFPDLADFTNAVFEDTVSFERSRFIGSAWFARSTFEQYANFKGANFNDHTAFNDSKFSSVANFHQTIFGSHAEFCNIEFCFSAIFANSTFQESVDFTETNFKYFANFAESTFFDRISFRNSKFNETASFSKTKFKDLSIFESAHFGGDSEFDKAEFLEHANFRQINFIGPTSFSSTIFHRTADFHATNGQSSFSLARATFFVIPDFIQANFREAPRLDQILVQPTQIRSSLARFGAWIYPKPSDTTELKLKFPRDDVVSKVDQAARWRALKRLAIQGHDHIREQMFFRGEVLARRFDEDEPWHGAFWFGLFYQLLSDFGRSILRPAALLIFCAIGFAGLYLHLSPSHDERQTSILWWTAQWADSVAGHRERPAPIACINGAGDQVLTAIQLSFHKTLPIPGIGSAEKINQHYACLYGVHPHKDYEKGKLGRSFTPIIPAAVSWLGALQSIISLALLFLLFLAIRNHFRIR